MNCSDVQDQLSAYYDGEMSENSLAAIAQHLAQCEPCASEFAAFKAVTRAVSQMPEPQPPATIWDGISAELPDDLLAGSTTAQPLPQDNESRRWWTSGRLAVAASFLLTLGIGLWMTHDNSRLGDHGHSAEFVGTMDHYLRQLPDDPDGAEQFLLSKYNGQTVSADSAVNLVGYQPAVAEGLPEGYSLASTSVLKMPCCTCVKAVCKRQDGSTLVLFEHDDEKTEWFGERESSMAMCGDKECCLVDLDSSIAATWKRGSRSLTAVGVRDVEEVNILVTWLDAKVGSSL